MFVHDFAIKLDVSYNVRTEVQFHCSQKFVRFLKFAHIHSIPPSLFGNVKRRTHLLWIQTQYLGIGDS